MKRSIRHRTDLGIVHHSATRADQDFDVHDIKQMHLRRGFLDTGYHFVIKRDGTIQEGRPLFRIGAHAKGHNAFSVACCLIGGVDKKGKAENNFTEEQFISLETVLGYWYGLWPHIKIDGHKMFNKTACPPFNVKQFLKESRPWKHKRFILNQLHNIHDLPILFRNVDELVPDAETAIGIAQTLLHVQADTLFGPKTEQAVRELQVQHELPETGVIDMPVWKHLLSI